MLNGYKTYIVSMLAMLLSTLGLTMHQINWQQDLFNIFVFSVVMCLRQALKTEKGSLVGEIIQRLLEAANAQKDNTPTLTDDQISRGLEAFKKAIQEVPSVPPESPTPATPQL